jgi:DNA repair exonuclease SbcCD ATPase subunit
MNWTDIIIPLISAIIPTGGVTAIFMVKGRKKELEISNLAKVIDELRELVNRYKEEVRELKAIAERKEEYIEELHRQTSALHEKLDKANSRAAVFKILKCTKVDCGLRIPPFGSGAVDTIKQINEGTLGDEEVRHEKE